MASIDVPSGGARFPEVMTVRLPRGFLAQLRRAAETEGIAPQDFARRAIAERLERVGDNTLAMKALPQTDPAPKASPEPPVAPPIPAPTSTPAPVSIAAPPASTSTPATAPIERPKSRDRRGGAWGTSTS